MPKTLSELIDQRMSRLPISGKSSWDTGFQGLNQANFPFDQFVPDNQAPSGFVWGESIWGVDVVDGEASDEAAKYGLA